MVRRPIKQVIAAVGGSFVAGSALIGLLFLLGSGDVSGVEAVHRIGWAVPFAAGLVIGGMALVLLGTTDDADERAIDEFESATCASCGSQIIAEWRLCPHCGALLECDMSIPKMARQHER